METNRIISVVGLGYVGLPVAVAFGKVRRTIGFDINPVQRFHRYAAVLYIRGQAQA